MDPTQTSFVPSPLFGGYHRRTNAIDITRALIDFKYRNMSRAGNGGASPQTPTHRPAHHGQEQPAAPMPPEYAHLPRMPYIFQPGTRFWSDVMPMHPPPPPVPKVREFHPEPNLVHRNPVSVGDIKTFLLSNGISSLAKALAQNPFVGVTEGVQPLQDSRTVLRITNAPYDTRMNEVVSLMGHQVNILEYPVGSGHYGIHPIIDRRDGTLHEIYVEFPNKNAAQRAYNRLTQHGRGRGGDLMRALFPGCKVWSFKEDADPVHLPPDHEDTQECNFDGFVSEEELYSLHTLIVKRHWFNRGPRTSVYPERPYQNFISIIRKYPWFRGEHVSLHQRDSLQKWGLTFLNCLMRDVNCGFWDERMDETLLHEYVWALLTCPGFDEHYRQRVINEASKSPNIRFMFGLHPYVNSWPFKALRPRSGVPLCFLSWFVTLIYDATVTPENCASAGVDYVSFASVPRAQNPFGIIGWELQRAYNENPNARDLTSLADIEKSVVRHRLRSLFSRYHEEHLSAIEAAEATRAALASNNQPCNAQSEEGALMLADGPFPGSTPNMPFGPVLYQ
ncbi:hypothetical protein BDY21DRAFT_363277 [Lineolata rhizophorae]|uniref:RRM domain-containing protein n=1 Tax=Lineolata rhizophorae TaxID=578093 RepID=A0A6A6P3L7_9PEZI|nr:hypothetical protein BDY21DRAFT_363277 [Lineolata rhizophorae]